MRKVRMIRMIRDRIVSFEVWLVIGNAVGEFEGKGKGKGKKKRKKNPLTFLLFCLLLLDGYR